MREAFSRVWLHSFVRDATRKTLTHTEEKMTNCALMKPTEQARRIVDLWQERPRWQRTAEYLLAFYGWLSEHEPAVIPSGPGSILKVTTILAPHLLYRASPASITAGVR
jgi:hypothetical protein